MRRGLVLGVAASVAIAAYCATGLRTIEPGEVGVTLRFGRLVPETLAPGLHWVGPWGVDRVVRVRTEEVRRFGIGLAGTPGAWDSPGAGEFLTGDLNLLRAEATVQYRVADPATFVLRADDVEPLLEALAQSALASALARRKIDALLREVRGEATVELTREVDRKAREYDLGVSILGISLTDLRPPTEVAADFAAAQSARSDQERRLNEARSYSQASATESRARASARVERARAAADRVTTLARARASRFTALAQSTTDQRSLTARRMYLDALRELLPRVGRKLVLAPTEPVDLSLFGR